MQKTIQIQAQNRYNCRHKYKCRCNHAGTNTDTTTVIYNEDTKTKTDGYTHTKVHCTLVWKLEAGVGFIPALPTRSPIRRVPTLPINAQIHLSSHLNSTFFRLQIQSRSDQIVFMQPASQSKKSHAENILGSQFGISKCTELLSVFKFKGAPIIL